jgi:hypothetical protein
MNKPPAQLDGADVLCWVVSQRDGFYTQAGSDPPIIVVAMAVARYADGGPFYLFKCDRDWQVVQDWDCASVEEARALAAGHSRGEPLEWLTSAQPSSVLDPT